MYRYILAVLFFIVEDLILIVSIKDDLHALAIQNELLSKGYDCRILECDHVSNRHQLFWHIGKNQTTAKIKLQNKAEIDVSNIELIWWRRVSANQRIQDSELSEHSKELINNDCRGAIAGILESEFKGKWISNPQATHKASNKIYQLGIAKKCGFRVPETLISQNKEQVIAFQKELGKKIIVKPVVGAAGPLLFTQYIEDPNKYDDKSFNQCPATYQEYIQGSKHIRLNCFGNNSYAAIIETDVLDWRPDLKVPIYQWDVPKQLHKKIRMVLSTLGLEMGIVDLKITPIGEFVWLEVNPQGQFLFLEPITHLPLTQIFSDYLIKEMQSHI